MNGLAKNVLKKINNKKKTSQNEGKINPKKKQ